MLLALVPTRTCAYSSTLNGTRCASAFSSISFHSFLSYTCCVSASSRTSAPRKWRRRRVARRLLCGTRSRRCSSRSGTRRSSRRASCCRRSARSSTRASSTCRPPPRRALVAIVPVRLAVPLALKRPSPTRALQPRLSGWRPRRLYSRFATRHALVTPTSRCRQLRIHRVVAIILRNRLLSVPLRTLPHKWYTRILLFVRFDLCLSGC